VVLTIASSLYGAAATWRRAWYAANPSRRKRLSRPVVSVGNLRVGGSGKTPAVEYIARLLIARGKRPAILSRGYARRDVSPGVTVVSDATRVVATLDQAGDEPLMLARRLPGVPVLVGSERFLCGQLAEREFGTNVHILDDGFQHVQLERDVDLLLASEGDLNDHVLPAGWLREPLANAARADAVLVTVGYPAAAERVGRALNVGRCFAVTRSLGPPRMIATGDSVVVPSNDPVFAVAGIAKPERFFSDLASAGWRVAGQLAFRDHYRFDAHDVDRIREQAAAVRASIVLTTEKDATRLAVCDLRHVPVAAVPLDIAVDPPEQFESWLLGRLS
jgi:tetraacyldisaccharide 4'-kinase